jgi:superfamily II DNA or RNA helicase/DNA-binding XRE family transcriptional regulator
VDSLPKDYADRIKRLRGRLGLTQTQLAEMLGVSFATVNRWENNQARPSQLAWAQIERLIGEEVQQEPEPPSLPPLLDFTANPAAVRALAEGERLSFGHLANPAFATEISQIDPLPHQRLAVYDHMLKQERLRFLLADDAGAGKTIMTGLYVREMLSRRLMKRILIVAPAGLVGNWRREMEKLFSLSFKVISGSDARNANPFAGDGSDRVIISVDTLASPHIFGRLKEATVLPYDLAVFDEAHKLAAHQEADLYVRKTKRYCVAEALAGVKGIDTSWKLPWSAHHLLLLTATPHMGKDYPFCALWRLLEPDVLSTIHAFQDYPRERRQLHFIRRTKEEMVYLDGRAMYPRRNSDTLGYDLAHGPVSEQTLYDETTEYLRLIYNKAKMLNRTAARLAMSVFQRRLASSTYALMRSFERRMDKLLDLIAQIQDGRLTVDQLITMQRRMREEDDLFESETADEETAQGEREGNELAEDKLLGIVGTSLLDLQTELEQVKQLRELAKRVYAAGTESKFERLREVLVDPEYADEKLIIFTEHRDTLDFLVRRLEGMGYTGQVAQIHGGMPYTKREEQVETFRKSPSQGGARFLVCTDAAGEGINLQFCWIMINYDVPWNPARLEQRMGRIHRYGQKAPQVIILNLVAPKTREGKVLKTLLDKLERIRKELRSDKVFDVIGRLFEGVSIKQYMEMAAVEDRADEAVRDLDGKLTKEQVQALVARERTLYGSGGDVARELPRLREDIDREMYQRLLPGYVRQYFENAAPLIGIDLVGDPGECFAVRPRRTELIPFHADRLLHVIESYPEPLRSCLSFVRPKEPDGGIWIHPGEPLFETFRELVGERLGDQARRGAVFIDPAAEKPYLFHLALVSVVRDADAAFPDLAQAEVLACPLVGVKQFEGSQIVVCPVEHLLLLKGGRGLPASAQRLAVTARDLLPQASAFLGERVGREMAVVRRQALLATLSDRASFIQRGFDFQEAELAAARAKQSEKARAGSVGAQKELANVKERQRLVTQRRHEALAVLRREPELISAGKVEFIAHALVVPSSDPADREQIDAKTDEVALALAWAFEESAGGLVKDVHTPELARAAGLSDNPGFDLWSIRPVEKRSIEVKGRAGVGEVEISANEWAKACNLGNGYWLYVVFDCATPNPRLVRVRDPFGALLAKAKGSVMVSAKAILEAAD